MHKARLERLREIMAAKFVDLLLVTEPANIFYMCGFADFVDNAAALIVTREDSYVLVDPRYTIEAREKCKYSRVKEYSGKSRMTAAAELVNELWPQWVGYDAENLTVADLYSFRQIVRRFIRFRKVHGSVETLRRTKDAHEIGLIRKAAEIADATFLSVIKEIKPGTTEKEIALLIDITLRKHGADKEAFETIAAAGPNSACPHAVPSDAVLKTGQFLKMDFGARYANYNSDITHTVCIGEPTAKQEEIYQIVLDAQLKAIDAIAPGKSGKEIDAVARDYIASKGYGDNFGHGLGHAIGIYTHDGPGLSRTSEIVLEPGMVLTVEPGIYIEGWGGVRIEDDVVVTDSGVEVITKAPKGLMIL